MIVKVLQQFTGSFILLTCSSIVEAVKTFLLHYIGRSSLNTRILVAVAMPIFCIVISIGLINLSECLSNYSKPC